ALRPGRRRQAAAQGGAAVSAAGRQDMRPDLREALAPDTRDLRGGPDPARRPCRPPGRPRDRSGDTRIGARRRPQPVPVGRRHHGPGLFPLDDHRARATRLGPRDQRPVGSRASLSGAGGVFSVVAACPPGYEPDAGVVATARRLGGRIELTEDARAAATGADVIYTDVWTSMGHARAP